MLKKDPMRLILGVPTARLVASPQYIPQFLEVIVSSEVAEVMVDCHGSSLEFKVKQGRFDGLFQE